jgi:hypothetical protein
MLSPLRSLPIFTVLLSTTFVGSPIFAQGFTNGGFETGDLSGWTCTGADLCQVSSSEAAAYSGTSYLSGFDNSDFATLTQTIETSASAQYGLSFAAKSSNPVNVIRYSIDGGTPVDVEETTDWSLVTGTFMASGETTEISVFFETDSGTGVLNFDAFTIELLVAAIAEMETPAISAQDEIARLAAASSTLNRIIVLDARALSRMRSGASFEARDMTTVVSRSDGLSSLDQTGKMLDGVYAWVDLTGFRADDSDADRRYSGGGIHLGADVALSEDMIVGLSFGTQEVSADVGAFTQDGTFRFLQPYFAYRADRWSGEGSLIYGRGSLEQTSQAGDGKGDTALAAFTFVGGYDFDLAGGAVVTPTFGFVRGRETLEGKTGTLQDAGKETVNFTEASLGVELAHMTDFAELTAGVHADWQKTSSDTQLVSDLLVDDGWSGRLDLGVSKGLSNGFEIDSSISLSGLGSDLRQVSGAVRIAYNF